MTFGTRTIFDVPMVTIADDGCHNMMTVEIETFKHERFWPSYDSKFLKMCSSCVVRNACSESNRIRDDNLNFFRIHSVIAKVQHVVNSPAILPDGKMWSEWKGSKPSDSRGHVIARQLGGPACPFNLFPQNIFTNRFIYYEVENAIAQNVEMYGDPTIEVKLHYYPFLLVPRPFSSSFSIRNFGTKIRIKNHRATNNVNPRIKKDEYLSINRSAGRTHNRMGKKLGKINH